MTTREPFCGDTDVISGADGGWAFIATTRFDGVLGVLGPTEFVAVTIITYGIAGQSLLTRAEVSVAAAKVTGPFAHPEGFVPA